ncbi:hypothetical protein [Photorhabdus hindustanensis]|uniref:hypothetical protein n=1 Tax=Photorhabdus hindustanensis TaxID=2918802 RepID=UPI002023036A|nr:hypothetical protein [Photorhabdus akhurstii]
MSAVDLCLLQGNAAGLCRNHDTAGRQIALADINPVTSHADIAFTQQTASSLDIALAAQCQIRLARQRAVYIAACQQMPAALNASVRCQLDVASCRQST